MADSAISLPFIRKSKIPKQLKSSLSHSFMFLPEMTKYNLCYPKSSFSLNYPCPTAMSNYIQTPKILKKLKSETHQNHLSIIFFKLTYPLETRFHTSWKNNDNRRLTASDTHQSLPYYEGRRNNHTWNNTSFHMIKFHRWNIWWQQLFKTSFLFENPTHVHDSTSLQ